MVCPKKQGLFGFLADTPGVHGMQKVEGSIPSGSNIQVVFKACDPAARASPACPRPILGRIAVRGGRRVQGSADLLA